MASSDVHPDGDEQRAVRRVVGGRVLVEGALRRADVEVDGGRIVAVDAAASDAADRTVAGAGAIDGDDVIDATGAIVAPGFVDMQCNGAGGTDLTAELVDGPTAVDRVARTLPRFGVTSFLPTVVTAPRRVRDAAIAAMRARTVTSVASAATDVPGGGGAVGATPLGLHFEGPLISRDHLGAHAGEHVAAPGAAEVSSWIDSGVVLLVTLAPEVDGALETTRRLVAGGVTVSAGHTGASPAEFAAGRDAGVSSVTHLYNAMARFDHRRPGPVGAALADDSVVVGLICDGLHVDPTAIRMAWRLLGPHRTSLVSDSAAPLGGPFGTFRLGRRDVTYDGTGVRTVDGVLAGSALALDRAVRNLVAFTGCGLADALATVTTTPADVLGLTDRGRVAVGHHADLTILDPDGRLRATIIGGRVAWTRLPS